MGVALRHGRLVRIVCLVTGHVRAKAGQRGVRRYVVDEWRDEAMPVNAFLVEFTDGSRCLFDTGQTARAAAPRWFPFWHPFFRLSRFELTPADEIASQLRSIGVEPGSIGTSDGRFSLVSLGGTQMLVVGWPAPLASRSDGVLQFARLWPRRATVRPCAASPSDIIRHPPSRGATTPLRQPFGVVAAASVVQAGLAGGARLKS